MPLDVGIALLAFVERVADLASVTDVWVGGSLATGDYVPVVSDLDLVAVTSQPLTGTALERVVRAHQTLDAGLAHGLNLGCQYADEPRLHEPDIEHPTWTHGALVDRVISKITRAELALHGFSVVGRPPGAVLPPVTADDVRAAAHAELADYWSYAAGRPGLFLRRPVMVDLGLTAMARGRHAVAFGELLTKSEAIEQMRAPIWLRNQIRARRRGQIVSSPRVSAAYLAWRDVARTCSASRSAPPGHD